MSDQTIETADESRISRRSALKAAAAVGVGAAAWAGPQITSFGATPAYASGCTGFTINQFADNRNTNQSSAPFKYQDDAGVPLQAPNYTWDWSGQKSPGDIINFSFPAGITCRVTIWLYPSQGGGGSFTQFWGKHTFQANGTAAPNDLSFALPGGNKTVGAPLNAPNNYANTRFAVEVQCLATSQIGCWAG